TPGCSRRARESGDRSTHLGNPPEYGPAKGASCRRAQGPARNGQDRRTARRPTRVRRAGGLGVARVIASLTGARARWMCSQHTAEGWEGLVERHRPFVGWHLIPSATEESDVDYDATLPTPS